MKLNLYFLLFLLVTSSAISQVPYHMIDGNKCDAFGGSSEWGPPNISDPANDSSAAGSDLVGYWFHYDPVTDEFCFAFERFSTQTSGPSSTYIIYFDLDCDTTTGYNDQYGQGGEVAIGLEWKVNGPWDVIKFTNGTNGSQVLGQAFVGQAVCGDPSTQGRFAEFCFSLSDFIASDYDACACSAIGTPGVVTLAGGNITSEPKDFLDFILDAEILVNEPPVAVGSIFPNEICLGDAIFFDGTLSYDNLPAEDIMTHAWDFDYDGTTLSTDSNDEDGTYTYTSTGNYTVLYQVEDKYGCTDTDEFMVEVSDAPDASLALNFDPCNLSVFYDASGSIDYTGAQNLQFHLDFGNGTTSTTSTGVVVYDACGTYDIKLVVTDPDALSACNVDSVTQTITFDPDPPQLICPSISVPTCELDSIPIYTTAADFIAAGGSIIDSCTIDDVILISEQFDNNNCGGSLIRVYGVIDACGNSATCEQSITINDFDPPVMDCPPTAYGLCDISEVPPVLTYADFIAEGGSVSDNCGIDEASFQYMGETNDGGFCPTTFTRTYSISDECGNNITCDHTVIIGDTIPPLFTAPPSVNAQCSYQEVFPFFSLTEFLDAGGSVSDDCGIDTFSFIVYQEISDGNTCPEIVDRIYEIRDLCGNTSRVAHQIVVYDDTPPVMTCPPALSSSCDIADVPFYFSLNDFTSNGGSVSDNCNIDPLSFVLIYERTDTLSCPETFTRRYAISDSCGNQGFCDQLVVINDTEAPVVTCPADLSTDCDIADLPAYTTYTEFIGAGASVTDNCDIDPNSFVILSQVSDGNTCPETVVRTYYVEDLCGNGTSCTQNITINDTEAPQFISPGNLTAICLLDEQPAYLTYADFIAAGGTASDNCDIDEPSFNMQSETSDGNTCPEVITRVYYVEDLCGNASTFEQTITINDTEAPQFNSPGDQTGSCDISEFPVYTDYTEFISAGGSASDNCELVESTFQLDSETTNGNLCPAVYTRVYSIEDLCGNVSTFEQTITIDDQEAPVINCPAGLTAVCLLDEQPAYTSFAEFELAGGSASDNCGLNMASFNMQSETSDGNTCPEIVTRVYAIEDNCGNISTCSQTITIDDDEAPMITCPGALTAICSVSEQTPYTTFAEFEAAGGSASDNCGINESSFTLQSEVSDGNTCPEIFTRTYYIEDLCGNGITCTQIITVDDEELPVLTCPSDLTAVCDISEQPPYADLSAFLGAGGSASDNCDINTASFTLESETSDGNTCPEIVTRVYYVEDLCGNSATCSQTITINDTEVPTLTCPSDLMAVCDISEQPAYTSLAEFESAGGMATDNCDIDPSTFVLESETSDGNTCPEIVTRVYYIEDLCGNASTCTQQIEVNDTEAPVFSGPTTLTGFCALDEFPVYTDYNDFISQGGSASDNCEIVESTFNLDSEVSDGNTCPETITRIYSIEDLCGNNSTFEQIITIDDQELPTITCPPSLDAVCELTEQQAYANLNEFLNAGGTVGDNCTIDSLSFTMASEVSDGASCPETVTRTYTIQDLCGNVASCTQTIMIDDQEAPTMTCPGDLDAVCDVSEQAQYTTFAEFQAAGGSAADNCGLDEASFVLQSEISNGNTCPEVFTRTYYIEDLCGNGITCEQLVTVDDDELPTMTCPGDLTAVCDVSEQPAYADYSAFIGAGGSASDNCEINEASFILQSETSDGNTCPEVVTRIYYVEDLCGNGVTCEQMITINDTELPVMNAPADLMAVCDISEQPPYTTYTDFTGAGGSATDNCAIDETTFVLQSETSDGNTCPEIVTRVYYVEDLCGNAATATQLIEINDEELPVINGPGDLDGSCDIDEFPPYTDYSDFASNGGSASDNCELVESSFQLDSEVSDGNTCPEMITRIYSITDFCGNVATYEQIITINDLVNPVMTCPPSLSAVCDITEVPEYTSLAEFEGAGGTVSDNCELNISSFQLDSEVSDGNTCPETVTRTYSIQDLCGNVATCTQEVVVNDEESPVISCPEPLTAICSPDEQPAYTSYAEFTGAGGSAMDNCEIDESSFILQSEISDGNTCPEVVTRIYYIEDLCGNGATCTQEITINDEEVPVLTCPGELTAICDISEQPAYTSFSDFTGAGGTASDNCEIDESTFILQSETSDGNTCPEIVTRIYYVEDLCGNAATCEQIITINDEELPVITCPTNVTAECDISEQPPYSSFADFLADGGAASDNCDIDATSFMLQSETSDGNTCPETITRVYYIEDLCGNAATCEQTIEVNDEIPPMMTNPGDLDGNCSISEIPPYGSYDEYIADGGSASDNCEIVESTFGLDSESSDGATCPEVITRIYSVQDLCGNIATMEQTITINDEVPPTISCPSMLNAVCDIDEQPPYNTLDEFEAAGGSASDNCDIDPASFTLVSEISDGNTCPETVTRVYSISDLCGNATTCEQEIVIHDLEDPVMTCPLDLTAVCSASEQPPYANLNDFLAAGGTAVDNCDIDPTSFTLQSETSDGNTCPEEVTRVYFVADLCGNGVTCTQIVTVNDEELPTLNCPQALEATCSISEQPPYTSYDDFIGAGGSANDNCDIDPNSFILVSETSDGNTCPEIVTRVYSVADLCGNVATCEQIITINDIDPPVFTELVDISLNCAIEELPPYNTLDEFLADGHNVTDNCEIDEASFVLLSETEDGANCPKIYTRTYQIADICGNITTVDMEITVNDGIVPLFVAPDEVDYECITDVEGPFTSYDDFIGAGGEADDNCEIDESSFQLIQETTEGDVCPIEYTRVYLISDLCGNTSTVEHVVRYNDEIPPQMICPPLLNAVCDISEQPAYSSFAEFEAAGGSASDNCELNIASFSLFNQTSNNFICPETVTRVYSIEDMCGNMTTCTQEIFIRDEVDPEMICPGELFAVCSADEHPPYQNYNEFLANGGVIIENCEIKETSFDLILEESNGQTCPEIITRTYYVEDLCGNTATCQQTITLNDEIPPVFTPAPQLDIICEITNAPPFGSINEYKAAGGNVTDNCELDPNSFELLSETSDGNTCPEVITRVYQVADLCGNTATVDHFITINDLVPPVMICPGDLQASCSIDEIPAYASYDEFIASGGVVNDECEIDPTSFTLVSETSNGGFCPEIVTRVYQVADLCGNIATCSQIIMVNDIEPPFFSGPEIVDLQCDLDEFPQYFSIYDFLNDEGQLSDNCGIDSFSFHLQAEYINEQTCPKLVGRVYEISDICGNVATYYQSILIDDTIEPEMTCPPLAEGVCSSDEIPVLQSYDEFINAGGSVDENCELVPESFTFVEEEIISNQCPQVIHRTYSIMDACDNIGYCVQEIMINDEEPPVMISPLKDYGDCGIEEHPPFENFAEYQAAGGGASDNCELNEASFTLISETTNGFTCPQVYIRVYQIADQCGNTTTAEHEVNINDTDEPEMTCPPNVQDICEVEDYQPATTLNQFILQGGSVSDNCEIDPESFVMLSEESTTQSCPETILRTYYVEDLCGNGVSCTQTIIINDTEAPEIISCPQDITLQCNPETNAIAIQNWLDGFEVDDNCGLDEVSNNYTFPQGPCEGVGETVVEFMAVDFCNNMVSCTATLTIIDTIPPIADEIVDKIIDSLINLPPIDISVVTGVSDICDDFPTVNFVSEEVIDNSSCGGNSLTIVRTFEIVDCSGNATTVTETIIMEDDPLQIASEKEDNICKDENDGSITISVTGGSPDYTYDWNIDAYDGQTELNNLAAGVYEVTVTDENNCTKTRTITITEPLDGLEVNIQPNNPTICEGSDLTLNSNVLFGLDPIQYNWTYGTDSWNTPSIQVTEGGWYYLDIVDGNGCVAQDSVEVNVLPGVIIDPIGPLTGCEFVELVEITGTNLSGNEQYYSQPDGNGTSFNAGDVITSSTILYVYDETGSNPNCFDEIIVEIILSDGASIDNPGDQLVCETYTLPEITGSNITNNVGYYTEPGGMGDSYFPGDVITMNLLLYIYDEGIDCSAETSFEIEIIEKPEIDPIDNIEACDTYVLPEITGTNLTGNEAYYTESLGGGVQYNAGDVINSSISLYLFDGGEDCNDEEFVQIIIRDTPELDPVDNITTCNFYVLPVIEGENVSVDAQYFEESQGAGTSYSAGDTIFSNTTLYIYDDNNGCFDEVVFDIAIVETPIIDPIDDVVTCDNFVLPEITGTNLTGNESYYNAPNGLGNPLNVGDIISTTQVIYIYDEAGSCSDQVSFTVTVGGAPDIFAPQPITSCGMAILPAIQGDNIGNNAAYFTEQNGNGTTYFPGDTITESTTLYLYIEAGSCEDEESIDITILDSPLLTDPGDLQGCDEVVLPAIEGENLTGNEAYYSGPSGSGDMYVPGDVFTNSTSLFIYDANSICSHEVSLNITVFITPDIDPINNVVACETYTLPNITGSNLSNPRYYTEPNGEGDIYFSGDIINTSIILYLFDDNNGCMDEEVLNVEILTTPNIFDPVDVEACDSYILPEIDGEDLTGTQAYYSEPAGQGVSYFPGDEITSSITLYLYDSNGDCFDEEDVIITIYDSPILDEPQDVVECDSYILPEITGQNLSGSQQYYQFQNAQGISYQPGDLISSSMTIFIYDQVNSCFDEVSFEIEIIETPILDQPLDETLCAFYILPEIEGDIVTANAAYYTEASGQGTTYLPGDTIFQDITLFIYDYAGDCTDEVSYSITILDGPNVSDIEDVEVCVSYVLPAIQGVNLTNNASYYTGPNATGDVLMEGDVITENMTIYIYDEVIDCNDEEMFTVTITGVPEIDPLPASSSCDFYVLPNITGTNLSGNEAYYTQSMAGGDTLYSGDTIYTSILLYVYDSYNDCSDEEVFQANVFVTPELITPEDVVVCDQYILPEIEGENLVNPVYSSSANGQGTIFNVGDAITQQMIVYLYDNNNGCDDATSFEVIFSPAPVLSEPTDITSCDFAILPTIDGMDLTGNEAYFTATNGTGESYLAGDTIFDNTSLFIFDIAGGCSSEVDINITIVPSPELIELEDVVVCDYYVLPIIEGTNIETSEYFVNGVGAQNGDTIFNPSTVVVEASNGQCLDSYSFEVSFSGAPDIDPMASVSVCDFFILEDIEGANLTSNVAYFTETGAQGESYLSGDTIYNSITLYAYDVAGSCWDEETIDIEVLATPVLDPISNVEVCDFYTLQEILGDNLNNPVYSSLPNGGGTVYNVGDMIDFETTIYVYDENGSCSDQISFNITTGTQPSAIIAGSESICAEEGELASLVIQVSGAFPVSLDVYIDGEFHETIDLNQSPFFYETALEGTYTIENLTTSDDCDGSTSGSATVATLASIVVDNMMTECAEDGLSYTLSFTISGGDNPSSYEVNGVLINPQGDEPFLYSVTLNAGNGTSNFEINDDNECNIIDIEIEEPNCECETTIGEMITGPLSFCDINELIVVEYDDTNQVLEDDDVLVFILHDGSENELGNIISTSNTGEFSFDVNEMSLDETYYVSAVVGNAGNPVDQDDPCFAMVSVPVIFYSTPTGSIEGSYEDCLNSTIEIPVSFEGEAPYSLTYTVNGDEFEITTSENPYMISVVLLEETTIILTELENESCEGDVSGSVVITVIEDISADVVPEAEVCNLELKGSIVDFSDFILDGVETGSWTDVDGSGAAGDFPILNFDGVTPGIYTFEYTIGEGSSCGTETYVLELEVLECFCPVVSVVAPDAICVGENINLSNLVLGDAGTWEIVNSTSSNYVIIGDILETSGEEGAVLQLEFTLTDIDPDCPSDTLIEVIIDEIVSAGSLEDLAFCFGDADMVDLSGLLVDATSGGTWEIDNALTNAYDDVNNTIDLSSASVGSYTISYTVDSPHGVCGSDNETFVLTVNALPEVDILPGNELDCDNPTSSLEAVVQGLTEVSYLWSTTDGNISGYDTLSTITINAPGTYTLITTDLNTGCTSTEQQLITGSPDFVVSDAGEDQTITCAELVVTLDGSGSSEDMIYQWIDGNGNVIDGATDLTFQTDSAGMYVLLVQNALTGCVNYDTVMVEALINYPLANIEAPDVLTCINNIITLDGTQSTVNDFVVYQWVNEGGQVIEEEELTIDVTESGTYMLYVIDSTNMCEAIDTIVVEENTSVPSLAVSGDFVIDCVTTEGEISGVINTANTSYVWLDEDGIEIPNVGLSFMVDQGGTYTLEVVDNENGCTNEKSVLVTMDTLGVQVDLDIQNPCENPFGGELIATAVQASGNVQYALSNGASNNFGVFGNLPAGQYELISTADNGCFDVDTFEMYGNEDLDLYAGEDVLIDLGESVQLEAVTSVPNQNVESLIWTPEDGTLSCNECYDPLATPFQTTIYTVSLEDIFGCMIEDQIEIRVDRRTKVYAPNVFSPNGDGVNDLWTLFSASNIDNIDEIYVYNRWGEKVWENFDIATGDIDKGWDGTYKGKSLNPSVFAWYAVVTLIDGTKETLKGDVTIAK